MRGGGAEKNIFENDFGTISGKVNEGDEIKNIEPI